MFIPKELKREVTLKKNNGTVIEGIVAGLLPNRIYIMESDMPPSQFIESNDLIERVLPTGVKETYLVTDPGHYRRMMGTPPHYQIKYEKLGIHNRSTPIQHVTTNNYITGTNARINNNSIDNSTNIVNDNSDINAHIEMLRQEITRLVDNPKEPLEIVDAVQSQFDSGNPSKPVLTTLLKALPHAASITAIVDFLSSCVN